MILISTKNKVVVQAWTEGYINDSGAYHSKVCSVITPFKDIQASFTSVTAWVKYLGGNVRFVR